MHPRVRTRNLWSAAPRWRAVQRLARVCLTLVRAHGGRRLSLRCAPVGPARWRAVQVRSRVHGGALRRVPVPADARCPRRCVCELARLRESILRRRSLRRGRLLRADRPDGSRRLLAQAAHPDPALTRPEGPAYRPTRGVTPGLGVDGQVRGGGVNPRAATVERKTTNQWSWCLLCSFVVFRGAAALCLLWGEGPGFAPPSTPVRWRSPSSSSSSPGGG